MSDGPVVEASQGPERFFLARVSFVGTHYHGWQDQQDGSSISEVVGAAMERVLGARPKLVASSRTDAGVHAIDMPVSFKTQRDIPLRGLVLGINSHLPRDIRVSSLQEYPELVRPRTFNRGKVYCYLIWNHAVLPPLFHDHVWHLNQTLDWARAEPSMQDLQGTHDFSSFRASGCSAPDPNKTITSVRIHRHSKSPDLCQLIVTGTGFLRHQVRIMAGTLAEIASGRLEPDLCARMLAEKDRSLGGITAPAQGLHLVRVRLELPKPLSEWPNQRRDPMELFPMLEWTT
jgi:tRNA pseudouridine38-40 synthase